MYDWLLYYNQDVTLIFTEGDAPTGLKTARMTMDHSIYFSVYVAPISKRNINMAHAVIAFDYLKLALGIPHSNPIVVYASSCNKSNVISTSFYLVWSRSKKDKIVKVSDLTPSQKESNNLRIALRRVCGIGPYNATKDCKVLIRDGKLLSYETKNYGQSNSNYSAAHIKRLIPIVKNRKSNEIMNMIMTVRDPYNPNNRAVRTPIMNIVLHIAPKITMQLARSIQAYNIG